MRPLPALQIPNLKAALPAHQSNFTLQSELSAKLFRQYEASLPVCARMLRARVQLAQENTAIARRNALVYFRSRTHFRKLMLRHDEQKLMGRLG